MCGTPFIFAVAGVTVPVFLKVVKYYRYPQYKTENSFKEECRQMTKTIPENPLCLSVIVPVYNVEKYLGSCMDSLLKSGGIEKTEIILVDDGSTDGSGKIADGFAERYDFISCLHKENGGLSDARNYGLAHAGGKYVFFCDSDDTVIPEGFAKVITTAEQSDAEILLWDGITAGENGVLNDCSKDYVLVHSGLDPMREMSGSEAMAGQIADHRRFAVTAWLRAVRRDHLLNNDLFFEKGLLHEDELWTPKVMLSASHVLYLGETVYCYRIRGNSIMKSYKEQPEEHAGALVYIRNTLGSYYPERITDRHVFRSIMACWADAYLWEITKYGIYRCECRKNVPRFLLLRSVRGFRNKCKALMLCLFGFRAYAAVYNVFRK